MAGSRGRFGLWLAAAALFPVVLRTGVAAHADEYRDPGGRFAITLGDAWHTSLPQAPAVQEWQRGTGADRVRIWVEVYASPAEATGTPLDALGPALLDRWLKGAYAIAGSSRLEEDALSAQGVDAGLAVRLVNRDSKTQVVVVLTSRGRTVYLLGVEIPGVHADDRGLGGELATVVSSFRVLGEAGPGARTGPPPGGAGGGRPGGSPSGSGPGRTGPPGRGGPGAGRGGSPWLPPVSGNGKPIRPKVRVERNAQVTPLGGEWPVLPAADTRVSFRDAMLPGMAGSWSWDARDENRVPIIHVPGAGAYFAAEGGLFADAVERPILALPPVSPPVEAFVAVGRLRAPSPGDQLDLLLYEYAGRGLVVTLRGAADGAVIEAKAILRGGGATASVAMPADRGWVRLRADGKHVTAAWSSDGLRWLEILSERAQIDLSMAAPRLGISMVGSAESPAFLVQGVAVAQGTPAPAGPSFSGLDAEPKPDGHGRVPVAVVVEAPGDVREIALVEITVTGTGWERAFRLQRGESGGPLALQPEADQGGNTVAASAAVVGRAGNDLVVRLGVSRASGIDGAVRVRARAKLRSGADTGWWDLEPGGARPAGA